MRQWTVSSLVQVMACHRTVNRCWLVVKFHLSNQIYWNVFFPSFKNSSDEMHTAFVFYKMSAILSRPRCVQLQVLSTLGGTNPPLLEPLINAIFVTSPEVSRSFAPVNIEDIISIPELYKCSLKLDTTDSLNAGSTVVCSQRCRIFIYE